MRVNQVETFVRYFNQSYTKTHTISRGCINGLMISGQAIYDVDSATQSKITVIEKNENGNRIIIFDQPLNRFADMSNFRYGATAGSEASATGLVFKALWDAVKPALVIAESPDAVDVYEATFNKYRAELGGAIGAIKIPLGCLYLSEKREIEVTIKFAAGSSSDYNDVSILTYNDKKIVDHVLKYETCQETEKNFIGLRELWLARKDLAKIQMGDWEAEYAQKTQLSIESEDSNTTICNVRELVNMTNLEGFVEPTGAVQRVALISKKSNVMPFNCYVKLDGVTSPYEFIVIREIYDTEKIASATKKQLRSRIEQIEKIENENPELARGLRYAGISERSGVLKQVEQSL